jgi:hypothetical protein
MWGLELKETQALKARKESRESEGLAEETKVSEETRDSKESGGVRRQQIKEQRDSGRGRRSRRGPGQTCSQPINS